MCDRRRVRSDLFRGKFMSAAANEAFAFLNALTQKSFRGWGDTVTAARDRAAKQAGVSPAQAERVWKRWQSMKTVNGDVYRALRNAYEAACLANETAAARDEAALRAMRNPHAVDQKPVPTGQSENHA
jgi:hypothetical protein